MADLTQLFPGGFDNTAVAPDAGRDFEPLPVGVYSVEITEADVKDTKNGTGSYLALELTVIGPTNTGRKVWQNVTLKNSNAQAESIGQAQFSALCAAANVVKPRDTDVFFGKVINVRLGIEPAKDGYPAKNKVTAFELHAGQQAPTPQRQQAPAAAAAAAPAKKAPWAK